MEYSSPDTYEIHVIVKGNVQGVGFRATTRHHAMMLGLKGTVRNLPDGTVEIYAQGTKEGLEELIRRLKEETTPGQIEETAIDYFPIKSEHEGFRIIY